MTEIRRARQEDAREIGLLRRKTLKERNKNDYPKIFLDFLINENSTKGIINKMKKKEIFCAWQGTVLIGTVDLEGNKIGGLFVKSSELGKGIGNQLMDFIENYAHSRGFNKVRLYSTKFAVNFYNKRGYTLGKSGYWMLGKSRVKDKVMEKKL